MFTSNTHSTKIVHGDTWINVQKKGEYIPLHTHDGILSYVIWVKIPYDINLELKSSKYSSVFSFFYQSITGEPLHHRINVSKEYESTLLIFPAKLQHQVYPFSTCDDHRISISGNIMFDTQNSEFV
jgi:hypothetical protein